MDKIDLSHLSIPVNYERNMKKLEIEYNEALKIMQPLFEKAKDEWDDQPIEVSLKVGEFYFSLTQRRDKDQFKLR